MQVRPAVVDIWHRLKVDSALKGYLVDLLALQRGAKAPDLEA